MKIEPFSFFINKVRMLTTSKKEPERIVLNNIPDTFEYETKDKDIDFEHIEIKKPNGEVACVISIDKENLRYRSCIVTPEEAKNRIERTLNSLKTLDEEKFTAATVEVYNDEKGKTESIKLIHPDGSYHKGILEYSSSSGLLEIECVKWGFYTTANNSDFEHIEINKPNGEFACLVSFEHNVSYADWTPKRYKNIIENELKKDESKDASVESINNEDGKTRGVKITYPDGSYSVARPRYSYAGSLENVDWYRYNSVGNCLNGGMYY